MTAIQTDVDQIKLSLGDLLKKHTDLESEMKKLKEDHNETKKKLDALTNNKRCSNKEEHENEPTRVVCEPCLVDE